MTKRLIFIILMVCCFASAKAQEINVLDKDTDLGEGEPWIVDCESGYGNAPEDINCTEFGGPIDIPSEELHGEVGFWTSCSWVCEIAYVVQPEDVSFKVRIFQRSLNVRIDFEDGDSDYTSGDGWVTYTKNLELEDYANKKITLNLVHYKSDEFTALDQIVINGDLTNPGTPSTQSPPENTDGSTFPTSPETSSTDNSSPSSTDNPSSSSTDNSFPSSTDNSSPSSTDNSSPSSTDNSSPFFSEGSSTSTADASSPGSESSSSSPIDSSETATYGSTFTSTDYSASTMPDDTTSSISSASPTESTTDLPVSDYSTVTTSETLISESDFTSTVSQTSETNFPSTNDPSTSSPSSSPPTTSVAPCDYPWCMISSPTNEKSPFEAFITGVWGIVILSFVGVGVLLLISICCIRYFCTTSILLLQHPKKYDDLENSDSENNSTHSVYGNGTGDPYAFMERYPYLSTDPSIMNSDPAVTVIPISPVPNRGTPATRRSPPLSYASPLQKQSNNIASSEAIAMTNLTSPVGSTMRPIQVLPRYPSPRRNRES